VEGRPRTLSGPSPDPGLSHRFAPSLGRVVVDQVATAELMRAVAPGDGVHGERLPLSARDYRGSRHGGLVALDWRAMISDEPEPAISREVLLEARLRDAKQTERIQAFRTHIPAGVAAGLHVHNCPVVGSIVEGTVTYQIEGEAARVLAPGDMFFEPEGARIARFDAMAEGVTLLAYYLLGPGQEPVIEMPGN
jgi:quercetin dioxygenase-like cupin family protein